MRIGIDVLDDTVIDGLFGATPDVTKEAIHNALCMAETMVGIKSISLRRSRLIESRRLWLDLEGHDVL